MQGRQRLKNLCINLCNYMWKPIAFNELYDMIIDTENQIRGETANLWKLIKINPEKWQQESYGNENDAFWVVAICGYWVIWFDDIEDCFSISQYHKYGEIARPAVGGQFKLDAAIDQLLNWVRFGNG